MDYTGNTVDPMLGQGPIARVDAVADRWKHRGVVAGPQLGPEDDMAELGAVRDLDMLVS